MNMFQLAQIPLSYGSLNQRYLDRINDTVMGALEIYPRLLIARIDLRLPDNGDFSDNSLERDTPTCFLNIGTDVIKRFFASLSAQIYADQVNKRKQGKRELPCNLNYVWVRERSSNNHKEHYHVVIMVNKDAYYPLGKFHYEHSLAWMINKAWASALGLTVEECEGLVHVPENPVYALNCNHPPAQFQEELIPLGIRLAYLAKERTKVRGDGRRNFGCSNPWRGLI